MSRPRVVFYCHNTYGLGHIVRSLRIAEAATRLGVECAVLTGCQHMDALNVPSGVEVHQLPALTLTPGGRPIPLPDDPDQSDIVARRSRLISRFCKGWSPHCLVADLQPLGQGGELVEALLDPDCSATRPVLGLPYAEGRGGGPGAYRNPRLARAYRRYEHLFAYADPRFDDILEGQDSESLPPSAEYVGIVTARPTFPAARQPGDAIAVLCGGGYGGVQFYNFVLNATADIPDVPLRMVVGPKGEAGPTHAMVAGRNVGLLDTATLDEAVGDAALVVSRAGYNTAFYLLQTSLPLVLIPQRMLNDDQPRRAARMERYPNVWNVDESRPDALGQLREAVGAALCAKPSRRELGFDTDGAANAAARLIRLAEELTSPFA